MKNKLISAAAVITLTVSLMACGTTPPQQSASDEPAAVTETAADTAAEEQTAEPEEFGSGTAEDASPEENAAETPAEEPAEHSGEIMILCTSDVHCGVDQGFGYAGLADIKDSLAAQGYEVILVDDGDSVQGEAMGTLTLGEANVKLMNEVGYDVAIPGNHEFDYGMDQFLKLADMAEYKYISCNLNRQGELVLDPYYIREAAGMKIAFVGVTTPESLTSSNPVHFQDESGETIYGFMQDDDGHGVYEAVQSAVDAARDDGADYVYIMGHMGLEETARPWTYADVISHTEGIDVFLDGHSHDTEQIVMKNKNGEPVYRCAVGTKMHCIGYSHITADGIQDTGIWSWPNEVDAPTLMGIENPVREAVNTELDKLNEILDQEVCDISFDLMDKDSEKKDLSGNPIRLVRLAETNLGDLCADAFKDATGADIGVINGGGIRAGIKKGTVTYGDIIAVFPFSNNICVIEVTGQQMLDALEWGSRGVPEENGGFLQVSGLTYEIDSTIDSPCIANEEGLMSGISGPRRVSNVLVDGEPIDPAKTYTLASQSFILLDNGDGYTAFDGCGVISPEICLDNKALIDYMVKTLSEGGGAEYSEPFGQDRIIIKE